MEQVIVKTRKPRSEKQKENDKLLRQRFNDYHKGNVNKVLSIDTVNLKPSVKKMAQAIEKKQLKQAIKEVEADLDIVLFDKPKRKTKKIFPAHSSI
jgi:hypothetical protein